MTVSPVSPRKHARQERSRRTFERILDAAARIFHEHGYVGATTNGIADEAGVSVGSLYQYFPNKDALLVALTKQHIESTTVGLADLIGGLNTETDLSVVLRSVVNFLVKQHDLDELHLLVMHHAPRTNEVTLELDRVRSQPVDATSHFMENRIDDAQRRSLISPMVVATIDASVHDVILRQRKGKDREDAVDLTITTALSIIAAA